jgi:phytoene synthase
MEAAITRTLRPQIWERTLLAMAREPLSTFVVPAFRSVWDQATLDHAYSYCDALTAVHSRSFHLATRLLPPDKRRAVHALYAFCRTSDDLVDCPAGDCEKTLADWRRKVLLPAPPTDDPIAVAWADTRLRYQIPSRYVEQLIDGVARDLHQSRYRCFEDLAAYAYGVASTVGLMSMHIIGFSGSEALPHAIKLGVALQITNILRDVGEDWQAGRLYLPTEELSTYGLTEADVARGRVDDRWRAFMRFQITRNRRLYAQAWPGISLLGKDGRLAVAAAAEFYRAILDDIEAHDYDVFNRRAHVSAWDKLNLLPRVWWHNR